MCDFVIYVAFDACTYLCMLRAYVIFLARDTHYAAGTSGSPISLARDTEMCNFSLLFMSL